MKKMFYVPVLAFVLAVLLVPSTVAAAVLALLVFAYLKYAGQPFNRADANNLRAQIAYRLLSVKLLALNGPMDDDTFDVHADIAPDEPQAAELRGKLREAAFAYPDDWAEYARQVYRAYRKDPVQLADRLEFIVCQLRATPGNISADSQDRLIQLAKSWKFGPEHVRGLLAKFKAPASSNMLAWK
ncbi:hypothetical protein [Sphingosinicella sp. BN140058]|uniref:hypothetical protein n=1 Tax=Sphingosinicella sp. BN140058 TaxID=1892855 RepID=UPI0010135579|nr:hypothetical protein [Sphingosinicella sp. BN140058]QAY80126.1 hypothetical protein ETR14_26145 [Sphingosinicella sp. BN140058]